jgi:putative transposase
VLNRGNARAEVFHKPNDYHAFVKLIRQASARVPMRLLGFCVMPNHFHLALWPFEDGDLSAWMGWLLTAHVRRYHKHYRSSGHVWQGRFKAFPIHENDHLLSVLRYIERNPLRANLVAKAEDWSWSSLRYRLEPPLLPFLAESPVPLGPAWLGHVTAPQTEDELSRLRHCVARNMPYGSEEWTQQTAIALGLESSLRPQGRPPRSEERAEGMGPSLFS